jgi:uncharacterized protein YhaN
MIIERVYFHGFGRFHHFHLSLQPGLNVVEAPNESGKSTLLQGIFALLYGGAQEGKRVRREAEWLESYRPWIAEQYGGEIDYTLNGVPYRLVRSLMKGKEQVQLIHRLTGEELQQEYLLDSRKERNIIASQLGLSGELFRRTAYVCSYAPQGMFTDKQERLWQQQLTEKLSTLLHQGEDVEVSAMLATLEAKLQALGKTEQAKQKPYGMLLHKEATLRESLADGALVRDEYIQTQLDVQQLEEQQEQLEREYRTLASQHQRLSLALTCKADSYHLDKLKASLDEWEQSEATYRKQQAKIKQLEEKKAALEPPVRLQAEDVQECKNLHYQYEMSEKRIAIITEQLEKDRASTVEKLPWYKPVYPLVTAIAAFLSVSALLVSWVACTMLLILTGCLWFVPHWLQSLAVKQHIRQQKWNIHTSETLLAQYEREKQQCQARLDWWQQRVGTTDIDVFYQWWEQTQEVEKLEWEIDQLVRNQPFRKLGEGAYLRQKWQASIQELAARHRGVYCQLSDKQLEIDSLILAKETVHKSLQVNSMQLGEKRGQLRDLEEQLAQLQQIQVECEQVQEQLQRVQEQREAIRVAREVLQEAYRQRQGTVAPVLQQLSSSWIETITASRYDCLYPDFHGDGLQARIPETGRKEHIDKLSTGTLMQMIFSLKMAIIQYFAATTGQQLPILLDDCFVYYDQTRLAAILPLLGELAQTHQILLCTCHSRETEQLQQLGIPYHGVSLFQDDMRLYKAQ